MTCAKSLKLVNTLQAVMPSNLAKSYNFDISQTATYVKNNNQFSPIRTYNMHLSRSANSSDKIEIYLYIRICFQFYNILQA